jgi:hypothetical protein
MSGVNDSLLGAFKPIYIDSSGATSVSSDSSASLSTTPTQLTNASNTANAKIRRVRVKNASASNRLGVHFLEVDSATPTFDTVLDGGDPAHVVLLAGEVEYFTINANVEIWVVGSAASTEYQVTWFEG